MLHIPILRMGTRYESLDRTPLAHHETGEPMAEVSCANSGLIVRDLARIDDTVLERFTVTELIAMCQKAADLFLHATLPVGEADQSFDDYMGQLSASTGMPAAHCRANANKIHRVLSEIDVVLRGLTRGLDLSILDQGHGTHAGGTLSYFRAGRVFGAVLPSNSPGVHGLWIPAVALKAPIVLKPGGQEPWSPYRIIQALIAAGMPPGAFGFYPTDHAGANEILRTVDRSMVFGDATTTRVWQSDPRVEVHGPGFSKIILGEDCADRWEQYVDVIAESIVANGGRSCINASGVWTPRHGPALADALAKRLAGIGALPASDPDAKVAAFANPAMATRMSEIIDHDLKSAGATDVTEAHRGAPRLASLGRCRYLLPTVIACGSPEHPLANREFLFPFASVVTCPSDQTLAAIGPTLVCTAITEDPKMIADLMQCPHVDRLNIGPIPTVRLAWDQPHEGNLFEHLYRQRAFQSEHAA